MEWTLNIILFELTSAGCVVTKCAGNYFSGSYFSHHKINFMILRIISFYEIVVASLGVLRKIILWGGSFYVYEFSLNYYLEKMKQLMVLLWLAHQYCQVEEEDTFFWYPSCIFFCAA